VVISTSSTTYDSYSVEVLGEFANGLSTQFDGEVEGTVWNKTSGGEVLDSSKPVLSQVKNSFASFASLSGNEISFVPNRG